MSTLLLISYVVLWAVVLGISFLLLGTLRSLGLLQWRFDELAATRPVRKGREGLPPGKKAPDFTLPSAANGDISLSDFAGRKVLLVFTQSGCGPCHDIAPELNGVQDKGEYQVLVVNHGTWDDALELANEVQARFLIVAQSDWAVSQKYQIFVTPYAFVVNEDGRIASKGIAGNSQYLRNVLTAAGNRTRYEEDPSESGSTVEPESATASLLKETIHA